MTGVSRTAAGLSALVALAAGILVGALAFGGSETQGGARSDQLATHPNRADGDGWTRGSAARDLILSGPALVDDIYLGLSCPSPNSAECDRVTIAVTTDRSVSRLRVWVAGEPVDMEAPGENERSYWEGSLHPAGLLAGPLRERAGTGDLRYVGRPAIAAEVEVEIESRSRDSVLGSTEASFSATYHDIYLHAGYG